MTSENDDPLPLWRAAEVRERREGLQVVPPAPPAQAAPKRPPRRRRKRAVAVVPTASIAVLPLHRNRPAMEALADEALRRKPGEARDAFLDGWMTQHRAKRLALGLGEGRIWAELVGIRAALEQIASERLERGGRL